MLLGLVNEAFGIVWSVYFLEDVAIGPIDFGDCVFDLFVSEAVSVHGVDDEAKRKGVPEVEHAALVALSGQLLQVLIAEETDKLFVASILLEKLLEV